MSPVPHTNNFELAASFQKIRTAIFELAVLDPLGNVVGTLDPTGGTLTRDRTRSPRADADWTCPGNLTQLVPAGIDPRILLPYGTEVRIARGYEYADGTQELLTRGTFRIIATNLSTDVTSGTQTAFRAQDRAERLDRMLIAPFDAAPGEFDDDVIVRLMQQSWRGANPNAAVPLFRVAQAKDPVTGERFTVPLLHYDVKARPFSEATKLAETSGMELYLTYDGAIALQPVPDRLHTQPVWSFSDGEHDTRVRLARSYASDSTPNYFVTNATGPGMPTGPGGFKGIVFVDDPSTSIDVNGAYGTVPDNVDSVLATSVSMCEAESRARMAKVLAGTDTIEIDTNPIGFLLEGDVITVTCEKLAIADETYVIASISEPLAAVGTMKITAGRG